MRGEVQPFAHIASLASSLGLRPETSRGYRHQSDLGERAGQDGPAVEALSQLPS